MKLPIKPPIEPMLSKRIDAVPTTDGLIFEPKWDGFRTLVFRDGDALILQSRDKKPMQRYFPELAAPLLAALPERAVLDGEIVLARGGALDFVALQMRIHPAASRVAMLAKETPVSIVFWDLLALGDDDLRALPFEQRRARLSAILEGAKPPIHLTPATTDHVVAQDWFTRFEGAGLDGVMAKPSRGAYEPGKRTMFKVKHERTCECVVAGFRWHKGHKDTAIGSLLLGLYAADGRLQHVGVTASFTMQKRQELVAFLEPYRQNAREGHPWREWSEIDEDDRRPGMTSRWSRGKNLSWEPLRVELVVEVAYDHMQGNRFRHTAKFRRWRTDKRIDECNYEQLDVTPAYELSQIFDPATGRSGQNSV